MGLTTAQMQADMAFIKSDLSGLTVTETVSWIPGSTPNASAGASDTFTIIRQRQMTSEELESTGFAEQYKFSFYALTADIGAIKKGDIIIMDDGDRVRVLKTDPGPAVINTLFHVGDEFQGN